ncbi:MAG: prepilin-type N-terminal cleavage/methylation domain-containing protein [Gemmatimonadaceae bacterium]
MRRRAFTLIEVLVALVVTGLVVALAYGTAQAGFDTDDRLAEYRARAESEAVFRTILTDALRHAAAGMRGGEPVFDLADRRLSDGRAADSLSFLTRGVVSPLGSSGMWSVSVWWAGDALHLAAHPLDTMGNAAPVEAQLTQVDAFDVQMLGRGIGAAWSDMWPGADVAPDAVAFSVTRSAAAGAVAALDATQPMRTVVRRGLERAL